MLQPAGKCPNVWTVAQLNPRQIPSNMAPLLRPKAILRAFQSAVHPPRGKAFLAAETRRASSSVLAGPRAQTFLISATQSVTELDSASVSNALPMTGSLWPWGSAGSLKGAEACLRLGLAWAGAIRPKREMLIEFSSGEKNFRSTHSHAHSSGARSV